tara:strand:+ start:20025 stop:22340 length:2316 start_codon:yes stop_codon:yes gene_type:complete
MIVDEYYAGDEKPILYTRYRDAEGNLIEENVKGYQPYFWIPANVGEYRKRRLMTRYPTARITEETAVGLDDVPLIKVEAESPFDIISMRQEFDRTYEADLRFTDRWLIDNVPVMPEWKPRKWWFDIEADPGEGFTTIIAVIDSDLDTPVVFAWADEQTNCSYDSNGNYMRQVRDVDYELRLYSSESELHEGFVEFLQERDPDMLIAHAGSFFDIPHLLQRIPNPQRLSPVGQIRRMKRGKDRYDPTDQPIVGRWQFDTAAQAASGTGFERVWKDSGGGQLPSLKLNDIAETVGLGSKLTEEIEGMDVFNGWYEHWDDFVDYCLLDTHLLRGIDEARNVTDFYVQMVRLCGVSLPSACNVTNFARGLLSRRTEKKAPSRYKAGDIEKLKGAEVGLNCVTGLHEGVGVIDYKGLYPSIILGGNLSYETQRDGPGENILQLENGTYWDQSKQGLLPSVVEYLFDYRDTCKQRMRDATTPEERAAWNTTQMAVKRVMASLYGMCAHIGYGWANGDIAHTITQEGRRCIRLLDSVATKYGYECLYGHTDSAFVKVPNVDEAHKLAEKITTAVQRETGNNMLFAELEAWMPYWLLTKKNRYVGKVAWPEEDQGKLKVAGFGMKASNTAPLSKKIQKGVFELICDGANENAVEEFVLPIAMQVRNGEIPLEEVSMKTRLGMHLKDYKVLSGASKAAVAYNKNNREKFGKGDSVPWTYIKEEPGIIAYREPEDLTGFTLDSDIILKKMLKTKLDSIYSTLSWDLERALGAPSPKAYGWW